MQFFTGCLYLLTMTELINTFGIYTPERLAEELGVSPRTLAEWRMKRTGPSFVRLGVGERSSIRYRDKDVRTWLDRQVMGFKPPTWTEFVESHICLSSGTTVPNAIILWLWFDYQERCGAKAAAQYPSQLSDIDPALDQFYGQGVSIPGVSGDHAANVAQLQYRGICLQETARDLIGTDTRKFVRKWAGRDKALANDLTHEEFYSVVDAICQNL